MTDAQKKKYPINKPDTKFAMKANLVQNEPASLKRWAEMNLYERIRGAPHPKGRFAFHDGPPYANGSIHLGHLLNKALKDIVVRSRTMMGFDVDYVPGWDCHGLPIEHKVMQELGDPRKAHGMVPMQIRKRCRDYAEKFVKLQSGQMKRLLTLARYDEPYLTMHPEFEAATLEVFAAMVERGIVYRGLKPVHWSIENRTALAEAELEYYDREDTSVYVIFDCGLRIADLDGDVSLMIWTTTPWTLPANLAVAASSHAEYGVYQVGERRVIIACDLAEKVLAMQGITAGKPLKTLRGNALTQLTYKHPFIDRTSPVVTAEYVTLEDGTGLVHTAPGHGVEDYQTGLREKLDIYCPVQGDGTFDDTVPQWLRGKSVWESNGLVIDALAKSGHLFHQHKFMHSYPHDWRSKTPTIFRATEQWFIGVDHAFCLAGDAPPEVVVRDGQRLAGDAPPEVVARDGQRLAGDAKRPSSLRERALASTNGEINFIPDWGRNRMRGMLESRPDWCVSRQRHWGLPIPAFYHSETGQVLMTAKSVKAVADVVRAKGSDAWFALTPAELLAGYDMTNDPGWRGQLIAPAEWVKGTDIFDVWFESGSSWYAVMVQRGLAHGPEENRPVTDLYLEGSDQHRGWFQSSLLPGIAVTGHSPFATVLTHGFMVDKDGRKMSKSLGNALEVDTLLKDYGADVCRWWVATLNTDNDIKVDPEFFRLAGEEYRKVRNTIRYLLGNLSDYAPGPRKLGVEDATSIDAWAMGELNKVIERVTKGYESFNFRQVSEALFDFCNDTLSAVYLAAVKDRLYCDAPGPGSPRRYRTQSVMYAMADALIRMIAPILPHTADEAWGGLHPRKEAPGSEGVEASVHLASLAEPVQCEVSDAWPAAMAVRGDVLKAMEDAKARRGIENPLDMGVTVALPPPPPPEGFAMLQAIEHEMADLCGVSRFAFVENSELTIEVEDLRGEPRCDRSWKRDGTVKLRSDGGMLTDRDAAAVGVT
ncbi:MAG: isoleucine--tRNA ligase [Phycisphaeraceae bacterium]